jgi:hypothetical protein
LIRSTSVLVYKIIVRITVTAFVVGTFPNAFHV